MPKISFVIRSTSHPIYTTKNHEKETNINEAKSWWQLSVACLDAGVNKANGERRLRGRVRMVVDPTNGRGGIGFMGPPRRRNSLDAGEERRAASRAERFSSPTVAEKKLK